MSSLSVNFTVKESMSVYFWRSMYNWNSKINLSINKAGEEAREVALMYDDTGSPNGGKYRRMYLAANSYSMTIRLRAAETLSSEDRETDFAVRRCYCMADTQVPIFMYS